MLARLGSFLVDGTHGVEVCSGHATPLDGRMPRARTRYNVRRTVYNSYMASNVCPKNTLYPFSTVCLFSVRNPYCSRRAGTRSHRGPPNHHKAFIVILTVVIHLLSMYKRSEHIRYAV